MNLVKENLEYFIPSLIKMVDNKDFPWDKIDRLFIKKINNRIVQGKGEPIIVEASVYDIIILAKKEDLSAIGLLQFLNRLFEILNNTLSEQEKLLLRSNIKQMLTAFDKNYLNFLGEIAVLQNLLKSRKYFLEGIEFKLPNGKSIDFKLRNAESNSIKLIEVVNIHLDSVKIEANPEAISKFLYYKFEQKIQSKKLDLTTDINFWLYPVLWGGWNDLKKYCDFYKTNTLTLKNVHEPSAYKILSDGKGYFEFYFDALSKLD